jgi:TonB-linked SusC/RagA family outer membrane protein
LTGESLPGVNVVIVGTQQGAATGPEGGYSISGVNPGIYDVRATFIGYAPKTVQDVQVSDGETTQVDFRLTGSAVALEEVVAIGYGEQRSENVTGSVSSVPIQDLASKPVTGIDEAITGKVAGVQVNTVTGVPGGGPTVRIRGVGSIGAGNDPLWVVDGFPIPDTPDQRVNPLNSIPPGQVESIEVLKDASATAIYGSRGSNGVIIVTTKGGTVDTQIEINSSVGLQTVRERGMVEVLNARQFAQFKKDRISDQIRYFENREPTPEDIPEMYRNPEQYGEGTNWRDEIMQNNVMHNQSISISGGNETIRARVSANLSDQRGTLLQTGYRRYSLRANIDANLSDKLNVGLNIAPSLENQELTSTDGVDGRGGVYASSFLVNPIQPARNADGTLTQMVDGPGVLPFPNPAFKSREVDNTLDRVRAIVNTYVEYELLSGLSIRSSLNANWSNSNQHRFEPTTVGGGFSYPPQPADGLYSNVEAFNWLNENTLSYRSDFGSHSVNGVVGFTIQEETVDIGNFNATDYPGDEVETFNAAPTIGGSTNISDWGLVSTLARVNYDYQDKYLVSATVRRDGSSRFGADNRWGTFPSFSVGWRISDESFMEGIDPINNLLLRVGYGVSGNFNIGNYQHLGTVTSTNYAINSGLVAGRSITNLGNTSLGWEEVDQLNVGLDLRLFQDRLSITADYYRKVSSNMLLNVETPLTSGFSQSLDNRGEVTNRGVELAINSVIADNATWAWNADFNIARNVNEVTSLDSRILSPASTAQHITEEGYPIGMFYGFVVEGFYEDMEEIENHIPNGSAIPGAYRHRDVNGDGQITPVEDFARIGNPFPDFTWGLTNSLRYGNFDVSASVTGSHGGEKLQTGFEDFYNLDGVFNVHIDALNRWRSPENPGDGKIPRAISTVIHRYNQSVWVLDNSNIWIRNIALGYTFESSQYGFIGSFGASDMRVYLNVNNVWMSNTNFQNPDESLMSNNPLRPNETRNLNYPISRTFTLGVNISL